MSRKAERKIIGAILISNDVLGKCSKLEPEMFSEPIIANIYRKCLKLSADGRTINFQSLATECAGLMDAEDFEMQIKAFVQEVDAAVYAPDYVEDILRDYRASKIGAFVKSKAEQGINSGNVADVQGELNTLIESLKESESGTVSKPEKLVKELKPKRFVARKDESLYLGFRNLDQDVGGISPGDVCVIAARPGVGKSAFAVQIIANLCEKGLNVGYFNIEMSEEQVYDRFIAHLSGIDLSRIRHATKFKSGEERAAFEKANMTFAKYHLDIISGKSKVGDIRYGCKAGNYDVVIIDYLQLVTADTRYRNRFEEVGVISKTVKSIAMELQIPVIVLSQLNRNSTGTKEPSMSELRESGDIEQDASVIILLWNKDDKGLSKGVKVEKNRQGKIGRGLMDFNGSEMKFTEINTKRADTVNGFVKADADNPFV